MNMTGPVPGKHQTNQRAELLAVVKACEAESRPIEIRSDSQYVARGVNTWRFWKERGWRGANSDLWQRLSASIAHNPTRIRVVKVKGHATWGDVSMGRISQFNKVGNSRADALAREGADMHAAVLPLEHSTLRRKRLAKDYHKILQDILVDRENAIAALPTHITDPPVRAIRRTLAFTS